MEKIETEDLIKSREALINMSITINMRIHKIELELGRRLEKQVKDMGLNVSLHYEWKR